MIAPHWGVVSRSVSEPVPAMLRRSSDTGAAWELLATPLSALATSLCYSHLGSKSRALTQLATAIAEIVSEASSVRRAVCLPSGLGHHMRTHTRNSSLFHISL